MKSKSAATLREESELAEQIAKAHAFSAFLFVGPRDRRKTVVEAGGPEGYAAALVEGQRLKDEAPGCTRRPIIYAINTLGSFDVTPDAAKRAGLI